MSGVCNATEPSPAVDRLRDSRLCLATAELAHENRLAARGSFQDSQRRILKSAMIEKDFAAGKRLSPFCRRAVLGVSAVNGQFVFNDAVEAPTTRRQFLQTLAVGLGASVLLGRVGRRDVGQPTANAARSSSDGLGLRRDEPVPRAGRSPGPSARNDTTPCWRR